MTQGQTGQGGLILLLSLTWESSWGTSQSEGGDRGPRLWLSHASSLWLFRSFY